MGCCFLTYIGLWYFFYTLMFFGFCLEVSFYCRTSYHQALTSSSGFFFFIGVPITLALSICRISYCKYFIRI